MQVEGANWLLASDGHNTYSPSLHRPPAPPSAWVTGEAKATSSVLL